MHRNIRSTTVFILGMIYQIYRDTIVRPNSITKQSAALDWACKLWRRTMIHRIRPTEYETERATQLFAARIDPAIFKQLQQLAELREGVMERFNTLMSIEQECNSDFWRDEYQGLRTRGSTLLDLTMYNPNIFETLSARYLEFNNAADVMLNHYSIPRKMSCAVQTLYFQGDRPVDQLSAELEMAIDSARKSFYINRDIPSHISKLKVTIAAEFAMTEQPYDHDLHVRLLSLTPPSTGPHVVADADRQTDTCDDAGC